MPPPPATAWKPPVPSTAPIRSNAVDISRNRRARSCPRYRKRERARGGQRKFAHAHAQTPHACMHVHTQVLLGYLEISMRASVRRGSTRRWWRRAHRHVRPAFYHDPTAGLRRAVAARRRVCRGAGTRETSLIASSAARLAKVLFRHISVLSRAVQGYIPILPLTTFAVENPVPEDEAPCERAVARGHASKDDDGVPARFSMLPHRPPPPTTRSNGRAPKHSRRNVSRWGGVWAGNLTRPERYQARRSSA